VKAHAGVMRVTGGALSGRALHTPSGKITRPTSARARTGVFGWLEPVIEGARVLDVFAGTGALGIEALSRGSDRATFVERDRAALHSLRRNLDSLGLTPRSRVLAGDARRALRQLIEHGEKYDLVLVDPPYAEDWLALAREVQMSLLLANDGIMVVECRSRGHGTSGDAQDLAGLHRIAARPYGQTTFEGYERSKSTSEATSEAATSAGREEDHD